MSQILTRQQYQAQIAKPKKTKFKNIRTEIDGIRFDSKKEGEYYAALKIREKAGEVSNVEMQRSYALTVDGFLICTYRADFVFWDAIEHRQRVIDVKGVATPVFIIKQKLMRACHGITIEVVK